MLKGFSITQVLSSFGITPTSGALTLSGSTAEVALTDGIYTSRFQQLPGYTGRLSFGVIGSIRWGASAALNFGETGDTTQWRFSSLGLIPQANNRAICASYAGGTFGFYTYGNSPLYAAIGAAAIDNNRSGLIFRTRESGSDTERMRITVPGNVKIGGTADRATTVGAYSLDIFNGTAPAGTLANGISIYSDAGEAYVMDAAGNATLISPHDSETNEWIFRSTHTPTGKQLRIDVERVLRFVDQHFGLDAVHETAA